MQLSAHHRLYQPLFLSTTSSSSSTSTLQSTTTLQDPPSPESKETKTAKKEETILAPHAQFFPPIGSTPPEIKIPLQQTPVISAKEAKIKDLRNEIDLLLNQIPEEDSMRDHYLAQRIQYANDLESLKRLHTTLEEVYELQKFKI